MEDRWDCIVVGAGAAGLSGALVLGRARRRTLVLDAGRQSNLIAHGIGGLLGHDGRPPAELYEMGRAELAAYPSVEVRTGEVVDGLRDDADGFTLTLADGTVERSRRVLLALGMDYHPKDVPGVAERWGRSVFHCPFCHGWEVRDRALGVLDDGPMGAHRALLLRMWSDDVTLYTDGPSSLAPEELASLVQAGVPVDERPVAELHGPGDELTSVVFADGEERACGGLMVATTLHQRSELAVRLGADVAGLSPVVADGVVVDAGFQSSVPGLFAAGDTASAMPSVAASVAAGSAVAALIVGSLIEH